MLLQFHNKKIIISRPKVTLYLFKKNPILNFVFSPC